MDFLEVGWCLSQLLALLWLQEVGKEGRKEGMGVGEWGTCLQPSQWHSQGGTLSFAGA